ncbi:MAG: single-stranded DNA-binding protein [Flavobacteriales bacterium]|nr:MAG: single-stranded DNA-binding protein [Flavobacteriales bacterium]
MAKTLNKVILIGHLGDVVKMHYFEGGNSIGRFPIATNETFTNKQTGERITNTEWHNIVVRNKLAEICEKYLNKGDLVYVEGRIKTRQWETQEGQKRYMTEIQADEMNFLKTSRDLNSPQNVNTPKTEPQSIVNEPSDSENSMANDVDDLPF